MEVESLASGDVDFEDRVEFRSQSDRKVWGVETEDGNDIMCEISGYDLAIRFNLRVINSVEDAEACAMGMAQLFHRLLMEQLLDKKQTNEG